MKIINFAEHNSLISQYMTEMRDVNIQKDMLRFRRNLERVGEIMAYEISKTLDYRTVETLTPLDVAKTSVIDSQVVLATIFRAGVPFHQGFLNYFTTHRMHSFRPIANIRRRRISMCASSISHRRVSTAKRWFLPTRCLLQEHLWS